MAYSAPKLAVRDSFDDEDVSDDVEDEVFIRDGRNGFKLDEERGVKRPLMAPRRKLKSSHFHNDSFKTSTCKVLCVPCCYGFVALTALLGLIAVVVILIMWFPIPMEQIAFWRTPSTPKIMIPCTEITPEDVWVQTFPKLTSESALQLTDVNRDGILDIIIGYGSGVDKPGVPDIVCTLYFNGITPCGGGLLALDGQTGQTLWQHWCRHSIYWVDCGADLTKDGVKDCLVSGRGGVLEAINGHDGSRIWEIDSSTTSTPTTEEHQLNVDTYAGRFVFDLDGDGTQDVLAAHTEDNLESDTGGSLCGHLLVVSGSNGRLLHQVPTPQAEESYYPPQVLVRIDGQLVAVWGTGGINSSGGLYVIPLLPLATGHVTLPEAIYWDEFKGVLSPPALVDINQDGLEDIVVSTFNSSVLAFDGQTYKMIWNFSFIGSESSSTPVPGYFNEDEVPDFLVKYQTGPGYPLYYYTQTTVLDGKTGRPMLDNVMTDTSGIQSGGLTVSVEGLGNDILFHWGGDCLGHEGSREPFSFMPGETIDGQNSVDLCKLRFNSSLITQFLALSEHTKPPGVPIYSSDLRKDIEYRDAVNTTAELQKYIEQHPDFWTTYAGEKPLTKQPSVDFPPENGGDILQNGGSNFRHKEGSILDEEQRRNLLPPYRFSNQEFSVPNRGRNREPGGRPYPVGEDEEIYSPYPANGEYPDVRKHGMQYGNRAPIGGPWRWRNTDIPPDESPDGINNYQDIPPRRIFDGTLPEPETVFDAPVYFPPNEGGYPPGQRDERTAASENSELPHGPRLRGDKRGLARDKRSEDVPPPGVQKLASGGVLVPSLNNIFNDSIDVVFTTYWTPTSEGIHILLKEHMECIEKKFSQTADITAKYPDMNHQSIKRALAKECLNLKPSVDNEVDSDSDMELLKINMGQMTVFRIRVKCQCRSLGLEERCASVLPYEKQSWPTVFGLGGNGYFKPRHK